MSVEPCDWGTVSPHRHIHPAVRSDGGWSRGGVGDRESDERLQVAPRAVVLCGVRRLLDVSGSGLRHRYVLVQLRADIRHERGVHVTVTNTVNVAVDVDVCASVTASVAVQRRGAVPCGVLAVRDTVTRCRVPTFPMHMARQPPGDRCRSGG